MQHRHLYNCVSFDDISTFFASDCVSSNSRHNQSLFSAFLIFSFSPLPSVRRRSSGTAHFSKMEFFFISRSACLLLTLWIAYRLCAISSLAQAVSDKLKNRCVFFCDEYGTLPKIESAEMMFSASRSRRLQIVPIIQSFSQLEKNYGKEGAEIIVDNTQLTIFGGFAPQSTSAETLSKALGSRTVMSGSVSRSKNDPSESLQMIERPLMTPDELKSMPKGQFVVMKTGFYPMKVKLKLFFKWGIHFDEDHPYTVADQGNREVKYASKKDITDGIIKKYHPELLEPAAPPDDETPSGGQNQQMTEHHQPASMEKNDGKDKNGGTALHPVPKNRRTPLPQTPKNAEVTSDGQA